MQVSHIYVFSVYADISYMIASGKLKYFVYSLLKCIVEDSNTFYTSLHVFILKFK